MFLKMLFNKLVLCEMFSMWETLGILIFPKKGT